MEISNSTNSLVDFKIQASVPGLTEITGRGGKHAEEAYQNKVFLYFFPVGRVPLSFLA